MYFTTTVYIYNIYKYINPIRFLKPHITKKTSHDPKKINRQFENATLYN